MSVSVPTEHTLATTRADPKNGHWFRFGAHLVVHNKNFGFEFALGSIFELGFFSLKGAADSFLKR